MFSFHFRARTKREKYVCVFDLQDRNQWELFSKRIYRMVYHKRVEAPWCAVYDKDGALFIILSDFHLVWGNVPAPGRDKKLAVE